MTLSKRVGLLLKIIVSLVAAVAVFTLAAGVYLMFLSQSLPDLDVDAGGLETPRTSVVYAADGSVLAEWHGEQDRKVVPYGDMPVSLRNAVVAIEDQRFWEHNGVDMEGIARALRENASAGEVRQGGSTITQQLVKILFTSGDRTFTRKVKEALLAYELEAKANKEEVLETYLNTVYFGHGAYGVESASLKYFGKRCSSLTLAQGAMLAGIIQSPGRYNPYQNPQEIIARRDLVLDAMRAQAYITEEELAAARQEDLTLASEKEVPGLAPFFIEYVKQDLIDRLGPDQVFGGGLRVYTTIEPQLQRAAEASAKLLSSPGDPEVSIVSVRHADGAIVAMVAGRDFRRNQFNLATQGKRQPGSAFKPFVLVTALENGVTPQTVFSALPYSVEVKDGVWNVQNYENVRTMPALTLQAATTWSVNTVYARLIMRVGPAKVVETARRMGISSPLEPDPAIALGGLRKGVSPLEMASAYGTIANGGVRQIPVGIIEVKDDSGRVVYKPERQGVRAVKKQVAVTASLMLHDVIESGTGTAARVGAWAAGKTGTTQSYRDAWFVGWDDDVSTAVWVGYPDAQVDMIAVHGIRVTGGSFPARIWSDFMRRAIVVRSQPVSSVNESTRSGVKVRICQDSMKLANQRCRNIVDIYLAPNLVPGDTCGLH